VEASASAVRRLWSAARRKDLVRAAWVHSTPHHGFARSLKVGKEDAIGMLMAVEMWVRRDHDAEWQRWTGWLDHIAQRLSSIQGLTTSVVQPNGLSNCTPSLRIQWDRQRFGMTGDVVVRAMLDGDPRIALAAAGGAPPLTGVSVTPYMMAAGEERIVADRLHALLSKPPSTSGTLQPSTAAADLSGQWTCAFSSRRRPRRTRCTSQRGNDLGGFHQGEFMTRDVTGTIDGDSVRIRSAYGEQHGDSVNLTFSGKVVGGEMSGMLDMGEYLGATWTATRRTARGG
jgi:L-seryl-tRNA(Ser) seleniumtransferase